MCGGSIMCGGSTSIIVTFFKLGTALRAELSLKICSPKTWIQKYVPLKHWAPDWCAVFFFPFFLFRCALRTGCSCPPYRPMQGIKEMFLCTRNYPTEPKPTNLYRRKICCHLSPQNSWKNFGTTLSLSYQCAVLFRVEGKKMPMNPTEKGHWV